MGIGTQIRRATVKDAYMRNSVLNRIITVIQYLGVLKRGGGGGGRGVGFGMHQGSLPPSPRPLTNNFM